MDLAYTIAGFTVGFIVGMTGVGGGSLMTPILVLGFGINPVIAVGTDLLYAAITKSTGILFHHKHRNIHWDVVKRLAMGSIPATIIAIVILKRIHDAGYNYDRLITTTLSIALILTSLVLIFKTRIKKISEQENLAAVRTVHRKIRKPMTVCCGAMIGILVTLSSVGAGALGAAILLFLHPGLRTIAIVGTDLAHAVPITLIAGLGHSYMGTVDFTLLIGLLIGSIPGIYLGSKAGTALPERITRPVLASMLFLIGVKFAF
jgi:hypothetical protein